MLIGAVSVGPREVVPPAALRVLVVEDDYSDFALIRHYLGDADGACGQILHADTVSGAFEILRTVEVHVILLDLSLPDSHGLDALERLTSVSNAPVIVVTGRESPTLLPDALGLQAYDAILKSDLDAANLLRMVRHAQLHYHTQDALRRNDARFREMFERSPDAIFVHLEQRVVYVNPAAVKLLRAGSASRVVGLPIWKIIHPGWHASTREHVAELAAGMDLPFRENRYVCFDGSEVDVEVALARFEFEGRFGVQVAARDISERVRSQARLRDAERSARLASAGLVEALRRQRALSDFSLRCLRLGSRNAVLGSAVEVVAGALATDSVLVLSVADEISKVCLDAAFGWPRGGIGTRIDIDLFPLARIALEDHRGNNTGDAPWSLMVGNLLVEERCGRSDMVRNMGLRSALIVAIPGEDRPFGVIEVLSRKLREFKQSEIEFVQAMASVLSASLTRLAAMQATRISEARFRSLTELASDWYWEQDASLRFTYRSDRHRQGSYPKPHRAAGLRRWEVPGAQPLEGGWDGHRAMLEARMPFRNFEYQLRDASGEARYMSVSGEPVFDDAGTFTGYRGLSRDITRRRQYEAQRQRFRAAMDASGDLIFLIDPNEVRYLDANQTACRRLGYTIEELCVLGIHEVLGVDREELRLTYQRIIADPTAIQGMDGEYTCKDGSTFRFESTRRVLQTAEGPLIVAISRDITERLAAERALQESESRFRALWEACPDTVIVMDEAGNVQFANPAVKHAFGYAPEQLVGRPVTTLIPARLREAHRAGLRRYLESGVATIDWQGMQTIGLRCDESEFPIEIAFGQFESEGRRYFAGMLRDLTSRVRTERKLRESTDTLQALSRKLSRAQEEERRALARDLHDRVGQNLTALSFNLEMLREALELVPGEDAGRRLRESVNLTEATARLIEDVSNDLRPPMLDDYGLAAALRWYAGTIEVRTGLVVALQLPPEGASAPAPTDTELFRITQEAINNIVKHADASRVEICLIQSGGRIELTVKDDGRGLGAEAEARSRVSLGVRSMRERAHSIGALFELRAHPEGGTLVRVTAGQQSPFAAP